MVTNRVGPPVRGSDLFGRDAFIELLWQKLDAGNVLLAAPRRFGKTSVMYRLIDAPRSHYQIVHADLEHRTEPADLIAELVVQLASDTRLSKVVKGLSYVPTTLWSNFKKNFEEVELLKFKLKLKEQIRPNWEESGKELFRKVSQANHPILFILDELPMMIDRMARTETQREEAKTLVRWLRSLRMSPDIQNVRFLIAGSIGIGHVLNELGEIAAINDFEQLRLGPFSPKVAISFLEELEKSSQLELSEASRRKILQLIGTPVPYFIQILFSEISKAHFQDGDAITPKSIENIYRTKVLGVDCKTYFDYYYGRIRDYYKPGDEKSIKRLLREMALVGSFTRDSCFHIYRSQMGDETDLEQFNALMTNLENDFYIQYNLDTSHYEFSCKLLRDWWLRHYAMDITN